MPTVGAVESSEDDARWFVTERVAFARGDRIEGDHGEVGTITSIRRETDKIAEAMISPDEGECPHCGLALPESGPPMWARCGAPY